MDEEHELVPISSKATQRIMGVLRIRKFMVFSISQAVSLFGDKLDYMALLAMIAALASIKGWESSRAISILTVVITLPTILFGPLAGVLVDRWNRRKVMIVCDSLRAILVASMPLLALRTMNLTVVFIIAFFVFLLGQFFNTARLSIIPNLVESQNLLEANSFSNLIGRISTFMGMLLGGLIVDWQFWRHIGLQQTWTAGFYVDSLTFVVSAVTLMFLPIAYTARAAAVAGLVTAEPPARTSGGTIWDAIRHQISRVVSDFREALALIRRDHSIRFVILSVTMYVLLGAAILVLLVPVIQGARNDIAVKGLRGLGSGTKGVGFVGAAGSIGLVVSSIVYGFIGRRIRKRNTILGGFAILGIIGCLVALSNSLLWILLLAVIAGLVLSPIYIAQDTLLHETVPEEARGRIFSAREWFMNVSIALCAVVIGQLTRVFPRDFGAQMGVIFLADYRRLLFFAVALLVTLLSLYGFFATRRQRIG